MGDTQPSRQDRSSADADEPLDHNDLWALRHLLNLTQVQAAQSFGVSPNTWYRWERGKLGIHPANARVIRSIFAALREVADGEAEAAERERKVREAQVALRTQLLGGEYRS